MSEKTATIIGATGLIGSNLLKLLMETGYYNSIRLLVRRPLSPGHPHTEVKIIDFSDPAAFRSGISGSDAVFCAVGTTTKKVKGDKAAYRQVDYEIPVHAAQFCAETGCNDFLLVSSVGANSESNNFYLRLKGEVEDTIRNLSIPCISVFRPSMLLGSREEFRFGEVITKPFIKPFSFLLSAKYKPVEAKDVAKAMIAASQLHRAGLNIYHYNEMMELRKSLS